MASGTGGIDFDDIKDFLDRGDDNGSSMSDEQFQELLNTIRSSNETAKDSNGRTEESHANDMGGLFIADKIKMVYSTVTNALKPWLELDKISTDIAKNVGMIGKARDELRNRSLQQYHENVYGIKFGVSMEDFIETQGKIFSKAERVVQMSNKQIETATAMRSVFGEDKTTDFIGKLDSFGIGISEAGKISGKMFSEASETGLNFENYSKNFLDNIEKAQTYTFKNGINGVREMAKKAAELQMSMRSAFQLADKTRTIEGAIEVGSRLQALGGVFAEESNPLSMLSGSLTDVGSLQDKLIKMFSTQAVFDKKTGEIKVDAFTREKGKAAAEAMGVDYDELIKSAFAQTRRNEIEKEINKSNIPLSDTVKDLLKNVGTFENGEAGYVDKDGNFKKISEITEADRTELLKLNKSESENIVDIAIDLRSIRDLLEVGFPEQLKAVQANYTQKVFGNWMNNAKDSINRSNDKNIIKWIEAFFLGSAFTNTIKGAFSGSNPLKNKVAGKGMKWAVKAISKLGPQGALIATALTAVATAIGYTVHKNNKEKKDDFAIAEELDKKYTREQLVKIEKLLEDGNISAEELNKLSQEDHKLYKKLQKEDLKKINSIHEYAEGGLINGPSHDNGGVMLNSYSEAEGGEYISRKETVSNGNNLGLLNAMNAYPDRSATYSNGVYMFAKGGIVPKKETMPEPLKVEPPKTTVTTSETTSSININFSGSIKLESNGVSKDITKDLLNNSTFLRSLGDALSKEMNYKDNIRLVK